MRLLAGGLLGLVVGVGAEASSGGQVLGQVRLEGGLPVDGARVVLFDLGDLRRGVVAQATTDADGLFALPLAAVGGGAALPEGFVLGANYPNPFNPATIIPYQLAATAQVRLEVFNALGQRMAVLVDGEQAAGTYQAQWDATDGAGRAAAAGVYLYRLTVASTGSGDGGMATGRMVLVDGGAGVDRLSPRGNGSSMRAELVEARPVEASDSAYGLVVSGAGLVPYLDADFRVGSGPVVVEMAAVDLGRGKAVKTEEQGLLGDVDKDGQITFFDAMLVMLYVLTPSVPFPVDTSILLGDVDGDGLVTVDDAWLIATYLTAPSDPVLAGVEIGQPTDVIETRMFPLPVQEGYAPISMAFAWIPPGEFQMGSDSNHNERPVHEVRISRGFWLGRFEVTQGEWEAVMGYNRSENKGDARLPVEEVAWYHVHEFIGRLNDAAGDSLYRLPTEAEWEYACRAGTTTRWSLGEEDGDDESLLGDYAWYDGNNDPWGTKAVGGKLPNAWGLHDMHGNVWEWVQDWYDDDYYKSSPRVDPPGPLDGGRRVFRGGNHFLNAGYLQSAVRGADEPGTAHRDRGFRLLRIR